MTEELYLHLTPKAAGMLRKPLEDKLHYIRKQVWVNYPLAEDHLNALNTLIDHPKNTRMPGYLLVGPTHNGKTALLEHFMETHPSIRGHDYVSIPVVYTRASSLPSVKQLYLDLLFALGGPTSAKALKNETTTLNDLEDRIQQCNVQMVIIDEIHDLMHCSPKQQELRLMGIKKLSNKLKVCVVLSGTEKALAMLAHDEELQSRFPPLILQAWDNDANFKRLLAALESTLPLEKPSQLHRSSIATWLHQNSEGNLGELVRLLTLATEAALKAERTHLDLKFLTSLPWVPLSNRYAHAMQVLSRKPRPRK